MLLLSIIIEQSKQMKIILYNGGIVKKFIIVLAVSILSCFTLLHAEPNITIDLNRINIPNEIRYTEASEEVNRIAIDYIQKMIDQSEEELFSNLPGMIHIGPRWWAELSIYPQFKDTSIPTQIMVPMGGSVYQLDAAIITSEINIKNIIIIFMAMWNQSRDITIRKLNQNELAYYWRICSYDLTEPLFVVDCTYGKYIFDFTSPSEIFFIEDITGFR